MYPRWFDVALVQLDRELEDGIITAVEYADAARDLRDELRRHRLNEARRYEYDEEFYA